MKIILYQNRRKERKMIDNNIFTKQIQAVLNNLQQEASGFEVYAITKETPKLKKLSFSETVEDDGLRGELRSLMLEIITTKFLVNDAQYTDVENIADNQHQFYVIKQTEDYKPFDFLDGVYENYKEEHLSSVSGFVFKFRSEQGNVYCFQNGRSVTVPNRKKAGILARIKCNEKSVTFDKQSEPLITFVKAIDAIIFDSYIITDNIKMMERNFDFRKLVSLKAKEAADQITKTGFLSSTDKVYEYINRSSPTQKTYCRKLMRALDSPVLQMSSSDLFAKISTIDRWQGRFKPPVEGKLSIDSFAEVESLIDLLDERYTVSEVTGQEYDTDVKKKV